MVSRTQDIALFNRQEWTCPQSATALDWWQSSSSELPSLFPIDHEKTFSDLQHLRQIVADRYQVNNATLLSILESSLSLLSILASSKQAKASLNWIESH